MLILWAGSTLAIIGDQIENGLNEPSWKNFTYFQKSIHARWGLKFSITEQCFGHQIINFNRIVLIFLWAGSTLAIVLDKIKKMDWMNDFWQVLSISRKKYTRSIRLNLISEDKKILTERTTLDKFYLFPKTIIRARWGFTFSITEHCFGHQILNFSQIVLFVGGQAPL